MITHRIATTPADFVALRSLISDTWIAARPHVPFTVATLEWSMSLSPPETDWSERVHLWEDDGEVVGIAWYTPDGMAEGMVRAGQPDGPIEDAAFELHQSIAARDGVPELGWFAIDGHETEATRLARRGFAPTDMTLTQWHQSLVSTPPPPILPDGYRVRTLAGAVEVPARVEVHRAAFAPSHMTFERYGRTMRQPHYAIDRDVVVEAPDGSFAAFAIVWYDPLARVGEFEPVGTHPDHRRRGLALAVLRHGLALLHQAGALDVIVFSESDNAASQGLYAAAGFDALATHRRWSRPR
jgi:ribosomal protein S18 acetylase RimI-like enzyme